ncbi:MAG: 50S ribosomal protein L17 [Candidatus Omnitrophota bacterium]
MRHQRRRRTLGVVTAHRTAKLRNLVRALVLKKRIETTHAKAKETSAFADKMITIAKRDGIHARRLLITKVRDPEIANILITKIAPLFKGREGGYTRVLRLGYRAGDGAQMALLEWTAVFEAPAKKTKKKKAAKPAEKSAEKAPEKESPKAKASDLKKEKEAETLKVEEKKDAEKKGGFLGKLRKFLKGDEN